MTALSHQELVEALRMQPLDRRLIVAPMLDDEQVGPATIDLRLGTGFIETQRLRKGILDPLDDRDGSEEALEQQVVVPLGDHLMLHPGQFVLGATLEFIRMPAHMIGQVLGRSSWARLGLIVATAIVVQPGYGGVLTLELVNMGNVPMKLRPGLRIAQLMVWHLGKPTDRPYEPTSKYGSPIGPEPSRLGWEKGERDRLILLGRLLEREGTQAAATESPPAPTASAAAPSDATTEAADRDAGVATPAPPVSRRRRGSARTGSRNGP